MTDTQQRLPASPDSEGPGPKLWLWFLVAMVLAFYYPITALPIRAARAR